MELPGRGFGLVNSKIESAMSESFFCLITKSFSGISDGLVNITKSLLFLIFLSRACPILSIARICVYSGVVFTSEEVTPKKEYQMARTILAVVYFFVFDSSIKEEKSDASKLLLLMRLYKPPFASRQSSARM